MGEGATPTVVIDTANATALQGAIQDYVGDISPMLLTILGAALGIALLLWVVRVFMRGAKTASR